MKRLLALVSFLLFVVPTSQPIASPDEAMRLAALGRVWLLVKYAHPRVALGTIDWDSPALQAIDAMKGVRDDAGLVDVVRRMLATLNDPLTRVYPAQSHATPRDAQPSRGVARVVRLDHGVLIDLRNVSDLSGVGKQIEAIPDFANTDLIVVDARSINRDAISGQDLSLLLAPYLLSSRVTLPSPRTATLTAQRREQTVLVPSEIEPTPRARGRRSIFIVNPHAVVPSLALSLRAMGLARIVSVGGLPDNQEAVQTFPLPGGHTAQVRTEELVLDGRRVELRADASLDDSASDEQIYEVTRSVVNAPLQPLTFDDPPPVDRPEREYSENQYPGEAHRVLAIYRLWGAVQYFFAYAHLMDQPWEPVLPEFIPLARAARNELEYAQVIARMAARLQDNHVTWTNVTALHRWLSGGLALPPAVVRYVEGKPVVTQLLADGAAGLRIGDVILAVDGESVVDRVTRIEPYLSYSTPQGRDKLLAQRVLMGLRGTRGRVQVERDGSTIEVVTSEREPKYQDARRTGPVVQILDGNLGYVDVARVQRTDLEAAVDELAGTRGIIFDMRGYPAGPTGYIVNWVNRKRDPIVGQSYQPQVVGGWKVRRHWVPVLEPPSRHLSVQPYRNRVVVLIDERAQSAAEHFVQSMKVVADATLIGSPTTGANGVALSVILPGGVGVRFTTGESRKPDGSQTQRRGHEPDIKVLPTLGGIRAGRDEVLERAVAFLRDAK